MSRIVKALLFLICTTAMLIASILFPWERYLVSAQNKEYADGFFYYEMENGTAAIAGIEASYFADQSTALEIPATLNGLPVTKICAYAFHGISDQLPTLKTIVLPDSVTKIHVNAFANSSVSRIEMSVYAGYYSN